MSPCSPSDFKSLASRSANRFLLIIWVWQWECIIWSKNNVIILTDHKMICDWWAWSLHHIRFWYRYFLFFYIWRTSGDLCGYLCSTKALHHNAVLSHSVHLAIHCSFLWFGECNWPHWNFHTIQSSSPTLNNSLKESALMTLRNMVLIPKLS